MTTQARSSWLTTPYGASYRLPPPTVVFEVYRRPLGGSWWVRAIDGGGLPLRVAVDCSRAAFLAAVGHAPGEYHLLPIDATSGDPAAVKEPSPVRVEAAGAKAGPPTEIATPIDVPPPVRAPVVAGVSPPPASVLGRAAVEVAIAQATFGEIRAVLAYAEGHAVVAAGLGLVVEVAPLVLALVDATIAGAMPWRCWAVGFPLHLRQSIAHDLGARLTAAAAGPPEVEPWRAARAVPLAPVQVGALDGLLQGARLLGDVMAAIREDDHSTQAATTVLHAAVRARLMAVLDGLDDRDDRDDRDRARGVGPVVIDLPGLDAPRVRAGTDGETN